MCRIAYNFFAKFLPKYFWWFEQQNYKNFKHYLINKLMITEKELKENGFVPVGEWCNRTYYKKQGFKIVEHQGSFYESDDENWSGNGEELKTIEDINNAHKNYIRRKFNEFKALFE